MLVTALFVVDSRRDTQIFIKKLTMTVLFCSSELEGNCGA